MTCAPTATRTRDLPLRRSFHAGGQPAASMIRAGLLIVWLQLNFSGFRPVLARAWHVVRLVANLGMYRRAFIRTG